MVALYTVEFVAMGGRATIRLGADGETRARSLGQMAIDEVRRIEKKYSRYRSDSIISRINANSGNEWIECDDETVRLINYAATLYEVSGGLFDITSGVLRRAWDFTRTALPDPDTLAQCLALIGFKELQRDGLHVRLARAGMELDFGGIAKEYAVDCAAAKLASQGVESGYVDLAGDMHFLGPQPDGGAWVIGIQDPRKPDATIATIPISTGALATSGDYERYFELNGERYCHILNPSTGMPVRHWRSVSVLAPHALLAGSSSTIAMLQEANGLDFLAATHDSWLAIDKYDRRHHSNVGSGACPPIRRHSANH